MKKIYLVFAWVAILSCIVSCQKSKTPGQSGPDVIYVRLDENADTRAEAADDVQESAGQELLFSIPVVTEEGDTLRVDAWISDMEDNVFSDIQESDVEPETRGVIRTTANMKQNKNYFYTKVYTPAGSVYTDDEGASMGNVTVQYVQDTWLLGTGYGDTFGEYCYYHWPADGSDIIFCSTYGKGASNVTWNVGEGNNLSFSYTIPTSSDGLGDAAAEDDLLFAMNRQNLNTRQKSSDGKSYADIHFDHALTAVRFVRGSVENGTIQTISLKGFKGAGTATAVYTRGENNNVHKDKLTYTWNATGDLMNFTQTYNRVLTDDDPKQDTSSHEVTGAPLDPTTNQEYTFFMIPQPLHESATIEIYIKERLHPITVNIGGTVDGSGHALDPKLRDWSAYAGKIITIAVNTVQDNRLIDIELSDTVNGRVKSNVKVKNTTNSKTAYIRVAIIANWVNAQGTVIYPYPIENIISDSRFSGVNSDLVFNGGFYYYPKKVPVGKELTVFTSFTAPQRGDTDYPNELTGVDHLQMTILAQGVDADRKSELISAGWWSGLTNDTYPL